ncbi:MULTISPECIES: HRDC domain-containing protein [unclassified Luteococcus]|uniref:HRDC domain-containing protein n=1 Tax=unclassified Luteococcus TaxID=2639923 RepID=UPI00313EBAB8
MADLPVLDEPADGLPAVVDTPEALAAMTDSLAAGTGPLAVDAERAQGFRYSNKSYLFQFRRAGSGTHILDPTAFEDASGAADLSGLGEALADAEWIIHAATQDLPCLVQARMVPRAIFDTELAGRLLGLPRVGLGPMIEQFFGLRLLKEHSAADWSRRPLPDEWVNYAALDVELLVELRERMADELQRAGKHEWARQEFAHLVAHCTDEQPVRVDRWRRTNGMHQVRSALGLAVVRELWTARDELAAKLDKAPGRLVQDAAICELAARAASTKPAHVPTKDELRQVNGFKRRTARQYENNWLAALERVAALSPKQLPPLRVSPDGPPPPRNWERRHPEAFARWNRIRPATQQLAATLGLPPENLVSPDVLRRITFEPPEPLTADAVEARLVELGSRPWQREFLVPVICQLF